MAKRENLSDYEVRFRSEIFVVNFEELLGISDRVVVISDGLSVADLPAIVALVREAAPM